MALVRWPLPGLGPHRPRSFLQQLQQEELCMALLRHHSLWHKVSPLSCHVRTCRVPFLSPPLPDSYLPFSRSYLPTSPLFFLLLLRRRRLRSSSSSSSSSFSTSFLLAGTSTVYSQLLTPASSLLYAPTMGQQQSTIPQIVALADNSMAFDPVTDR